MAYDSTPAPEGSQSPRRAELDEPGDGSPRRVPAALIVALVLSLAGAGVADYLTWVHYDLSMLSCGVGDCHTVQASPYATIGSIPIALLGLGMLLAGAALAIVRWRYPALS